MDMKATPNPIRGRMGTLPVLSLTIIPIAKNAKPEYITIDTARFFLLISDRIVLGIYFLVFKMNVST